MADVCANFDTDEDAVIQELLLTLSHIFGRRGARAADSEDMEKMLAKSQSMVYLPPMPKAAADILLKHNKNTLHTFSTYVKTFAEQYVDGEENELPLSKYRITGQDSKESGRLLPSLAFPSARSAFVALSGHGDSFETIHDLASSSRQGIFLQEAIIPHLAVHPDESRQPLNSYILDFFNHGDLKTLSIANGIRREDVWFVLNDFSMVLGTVCASLAVHLGLVPKGREADDEVLNVVGQGDDIENDEDDKEAALRTELLPNVNDARSVPAPQHATKRKVKVEESWDDAEDKLEEAEFIEEFVEDSRSAEEEYERLMTVYRALTGLRKAYDEKFKVIWA